MKNLIGFFIRYNLSFHLSADYSSILPLITNNIMKYFFTLCLMMSVYLVNAQQKNKLIGVIKDSVTKQPLPYSTIINLYTNKTNVADKRGLFSIAIKENQLISFASIGYNFDTVRITEKKIAQDTLFVFLSPLTHRLLDVTVFASKKYNAYQLDSLERRRDFFQLMSEHTQPVFSSANQGPGIGLNLDHFYNREKRKRNAIGMFDQIEDEQYINYRFNPEEVGKYASLNADSLLLFMQQNRPSYAWLRKHTSEEDLIYYINDRLKVFFGRKENH